MPHIKIKDRIKSLRRVKASELKPNPNNWRTHPEAQRSALQGSLNELGYYDAVVARVLKDGSLELVDGHLRADMDPDTKIPVLITDLTEEEAAKAILTHDPLAAMAGQDDELLAGLAGMVEFADGELAAVVDGLLPVVPAQITGDEIPPPPERPETQPGDLWVLGEHRLLCGDSTRKKSVEQLMDGGSAALCFTSPPYAQQRDYTAASDCSDWDAMMQGVFANLPMVPKGQVLVNLGLIHRHGEWVPYWDGWIEWMRKQGWKRFGWYVWDKLEGTPGNTNGRLRMTHEWVFHFCKESVPARKTSPCKHAGEIQSATGPRGKDGKVNPNWGHQGKPVASHKVIDSVVRASPAKGGYGDHPAPFSTRFAAEILDVYPGSVYDPFMGSGTTLIAAEQLGRRCFGMEIEPAYCDVIVQRWENLTGKKAERIPAEVTA